MTQEANNNDQNTGDQHPQGISLEDWAKTPDSVKNFITSHQEWKQQRETKPENRLPTSLILFLNFVVIGAATFLLGDRVTLSCVTPYQVSAVTAVFISLMIFHLIWRNAYPVMPKTTEGEFIQLPIITVPLSVVIRILNELHPWKLTSRLLGVFLAIFLLLGLFLNLSRYSPFYAEAGSSLQGFSIERFDKPPEKLTLGEPLTIMTKEKVFVEAVLLGAAKARCAWSTATGRQIEAESCSTVFSIQPGAQSDILTVLVQPACGTRQHSVNLPIVVQP